MTYEGRSRAGVAVLPALGEAREPEASLFPVLRAPPASAAPLPLEAHLGWIEPALAPEPELPIGAVVVEAASPGLDAPPAPTAGPPIGLMPVDPW